jgi:hypothetical protein
VPILTKSAARPSEVLCVCEVRVGIPRERLDDIRRFYMETLRLPPWPDERQIPGGWGAGNPRRGLFLEFQHDPVVDPLRRRFTLVVDDLAALEERLAEQEWACQRIRGFGWSDQCVLMHDPAGHLIEVRQTQPL